MNLKTYIYRARDSAGTLVEGEMDGSDASAVKLALAGEGLFPVSVAVKKTAFDIRNIFRIRRRPDPKILIALTRQFAALFKAGVAMDRIMTTLSKQAESDELKSVLKQIGADVTSGKPLSEAFGKHPRFFSRLYVSMLSVGEVGGVLDSTLAELTKVMQREHRIIAGVKSAVLYPKIVIMAFTAVVILMMVYVIPVFADFYAGYGAKLPLPTRIMIGLSDAIVKYWYIAVAVFAGSYIMFKKYTAIGPGRLNLDRFKFKLPVFGKLNLMTANARFCHLVSTLYRSGLPLSRALPVVSETIGNEAFRREIKMVQDDIDKGASLAGAMEKTKYFTPLVTETAAVGESAGSLDDMLEGTGVFYDDEITDMLGRLTTLIEPLLLVGIFAMVALLALAVFLPMWNITRVILPAG